MTVEEVYNRGLTLLPANRAWDASLEQYAVPWVNAALCEALETENSIRLAGGSAALTRAPVLRDITDEIPCDARLVHYAFPYFIASMASKDDGDDYWSQDYRRRYIAALLETAKAYPAAIENCY